MQASEAIQAELDAMQATQLAAALKASRSWLSLPLRAGERTIGLLNLLHDDANRYGAGDIELARTFANQLAVAIDNIYLNERTGRSAAADERSRIARELHDSLTQTLFTASVLAEATPRIWIKDRDIARQNMEKLSVLIRGALAEMRSLLLELRPGAPTDQSLSQLFNTLTEAARARSNMTVSLGIEGDRELPDDVTLTLYHIAQEALNNVVRHAEATWVAITLLDEPDRVALHIRDDGRGFDPQVIPAGHMGISIMAERAQKIGADFHIHSQPGRGTEVIATWPVPTGSANHD
jgi:signal transduction histidine kinase